MVGGSGERTQDAAGLPVPAARAPVESPDARKGFCGTGSGFAAVPDAGKVRGGSTRVSVRMGLCGAGLGRKMLAGVGAGVGVPCPAVPEGSFPNSVWKSPK